MFYVSRVDGIMTPYEPRRVPIGRRVDTIEEISRIKEGTRERPGGAAAQKRLLDRYSRQGHQEGRRKVSTAGELMSSPVVRVEGQEPLERVWRLLRSRSLRHMPVVDQEDRLIGIVSDRDFIDFFEQQIPLDNPVRQHMVSNVLSAATVTSLRELARVMFEERISLIPITDSAGHVVGVVTRSDILRVLVHGAPLELWL